MIVPSRHLLRAGRKWLLGGTSLAALAFTAGIAPRSHAAGILSQGGSAAIAPVASSVTAALAAEQQSNTVALQAQNQLSRITNALAAMQNMQTAARNLAIAAPSSVPDGLQSDGLVPDSGLAAPGIANPVTTWIGADTPTQSAAAGKTLVTINQTAAAAALNWNSFNVGKNTTVNFNQQGNTTWTALNTISDTNVPSQILGSITASGHVYLIDPNGIIFGGASQINVGGLVASSAALSASQYFTNGIFSTSSGAGAGASYAYSFTNAGGAITVDPGAQITTNVPANVTTGGGIVLLLGTQVNNEGTITTADGQTELAAGDNFRIRPGYGTNSNPSSTTNGNEVAVELDKPGSSLQGGSGLVENSGMITAATGDITLAGETVLQNGVALSTTSVAVRGTIHLLAADSGASDTFSSVTLGSNGFTLVEPDLSSAGTELDSQRAALIADSATANGERAGAFNKDFDDISLLDDQQDESRIEINSSGVVHFADGSDTSAPGGQLAVSAAQRVQVDSGALLDVSGSYAVAMAMASNDILVNIQNNELRDDPQNRLTQNLRNNSVYVNAGTLSLVPASAADASARDYTEGGLLEVSGYLANVGHTIGEYTAVGGTIDISTGSGGAIVAQSGSNFDIDGGTLQYQSGYLQQSYLVGANGQIYNVNNAPADITYTGIYNGFSVNHPAWGVTQTYANVLNAPSEIYENGYTVGRAAGTLTLSSGTTIFNGTIQAATVNGSTQTAADPAGVTDPYLYTQTEIAEPGTLNIENIGNEAVSAVVSSVVLGTTDAKAADLGQKIAANLQGKTLLNAESLDQSDLGKIQVVTDRGIVVAAPLRVAPGGQVNLYGSSIDIAANITAPGGSVSAGQVAAFGGTPVYLTAPNGSTGNTVVGNGVIISTAGLWTNLMLDPDIIFTQAFFNGGAVDLGSAATLKLGKGSVINTSAGGVVSVTGAIKGGAGGAITLAAGTQINGVGNSKDNLILQGTLDGMGYTGGGALTLAAPSFLITGTATALDNNRVTLDPAFFTQGFSSYNLVGTKDIMVARNTVVNVSEPTYQLTAASDLLPTGSPAAAAFTVALDPLYVANSSDSAITQRPGASFNAAIVPLDGTASQSTPSVINNIALTIGAGSQINVDPGQAIDLQATGQITIDGSLTAAGGTISAVSDFNTDAALPGGPGTVSIWVGAKARLDASANSVSFENAAGDRISIAPSGGAITLGSDTSTAAVIIRKGAIIAASGSAATDKIAASALGDTDGAQAQGVAIPVEGAGGSISLASEEGLYNDGTLIAAAGGSSAAGGSLNMTLQADDVPDSTGSMEATPRIFTITQNDAGPQLAADLTPGSSEGLTIGTAAISAQQLKAGGFGSVTLFARDAFLFKGNVTLKTAQSISLEEGYYTDTSRHGSVTLDAPYVLLSGNTPDQSSAFPVHYFSLINGFSAQHATGAFTVNAATIDINNSVRFGGLLPADGTIPASDLAGFGTINLNSSGDLQFIAPNDYGGGLTSASNSDNFVTTANLNLTAREIYAIGAAGSEAGNVVVGAATSAVIVAGYDPTVAGTNGNFNPKGVLTISRTPGTTPVAPDTLAGALTFDAAHVIQDGVVLQPLGSITFGSVAQFNISNQLTERTGDANGVVDFGAGSITSVSAAGMNVPFGGTVDGVNYDVNGLPVTSATNTGLGLASVNNGVGTGTITIAALTTNIGSGATLDLQGGGALTGAGFISGEGGSSDVLANPLLNVSASGVTQPSLASNPVYAIVSGAQPTEAIAYTGSGATGSTPGLGQQIVIPAGVPGLPAGTYTLLPASYALEPGGYRVEFDGGTALDSPSITALADGSYAVAGYTALANTNVRSSLASDLTITPGATVLNYAQYDQESYAAFLEATAVTYGAIRPALPVDAGTLVLNVPISSRVSVTNAGSVLFAAAPGGIGGTLQISGANISGAEPNLDIYGATPAAGLPPGTVSLSAAQIDAFDPLTLELGIGGGGNNAKVDSITLEAGATLRAARVLLTALSGGITLKDGSSIDTIGEATLLQGSATEGLLSNGGASVLDVGNGYFVYGTTPVSEGAYGPITVDGGASIYTDGSIAFSTSSAVNISVNASYGGKYLDLAVPEINIGNTAGANAPPGLMLTQAVVQALTQGIPGQGVPGVQILDLTAFDSLNLYGTTAFNLTNANVQLEINSPAIYGFGSGSDVATISAGTIVWNGIATTAADQTTIISSLPGGTVMGGPGTGSGTLNLDAQTIILGYSNLDLQQRDVPLTRLAAGFSTVNLNATTEITANNQGSLAVYQSVPQYGQAGTGGNLNLNTPLLTAADAAIIGFTAGGAIQVGPAAGEIAASGLATEAAGGEIDLTAQNIGITGSVILPSGKLNLQAVDYNVGASDNITLGSTSLINLAGVTTTNVDQTVYGFGGDLIMASAAGNITQDAGSVINVSAVNNTAGNISITATAVAPSGQPPVGQVALNGTLTGGSSGGYASGGFNIAAQSLGSFAALNASLDAGGFFETRDFDIKQGSLIIGNGVQAHNVSVSLDNGSLTVTGLINASGNGGGSISLAASDDLTLGANAALDAQGTALQTDRYGANVEPDNVIASENAPLVSLTTSTGELTLQSGAQIDLRSEDGVARGDLELNVPRLGSATSGDADIEAAGPVSVTGAATIAVNAFWTYHGLTDPNSSTDGLITQAYLNQINTGQTLPYMANAATNADLAARLTGLSTYGSAFHFRPGINIASATPDGDLTVEGDIDLAGYRYGPAAAAYGAGEPGVLDIRAGGNLNVYGSITDGFEQPVSDAGTAFAKGWVVFDSEPYNQNQIIPAAIIINKGSSFSDAAPVNFAVAITGGTFAASSVAPVALTIAYTTKTTLGFVATSNISNAAGQVIFAKGQYVAAGSELAKGDMIAAFGTFPFTIQVGPVTWPANTPFTVTTNIASGGLGVQLAAGMTLQAGAFIPGGSTLKFNKSDPGLATTPGGDTYVETRPVGAGGSQGQLSGLAALLPAGDMSWSLALVSGADTNAANPDATQAANTLATGTGNLTLADTHYGIHGNAVVPAYSVIRTGTGSLSLISGGSINEDSAFGIYTAGAQSAPILDNSGNNDYDLAQGNEAGNTLLGAGNATLAALVANYAANYPTNGGNVLVSAQDDLNGFISTTTTPNPDFDSVAVTDTDALGQWLWQQGGDGDSAAWWIEYGSLTLTGAVDGSAVSPYIAQYTGFQGIGTLGGGNLTVNVGGNASGLDLDVASNGRVKANGTLVQDGGGALNVTIGGAVNFVAPGGGAVSNTEDAAGIISDLRGPTNISVGSLGMIVPQYGSVAAGDPRTLPPLDSEIAQLGQGIDLAPGDSAVTIDARGDLAIGSAVNPGTVQNYVNATPIEVAVKGVETAGHGVTDFSLWTGSTSIGLFSAGGDVAPEESAGGNPATQNDTQQSYYPPNLLVTSQNGDIYFGEQATELAPSADGELELLAVNSIIGTATSAGSSVVSMSGAALSMVATPFDPGIEIFRKNGSILYTNHSQLSAGAPVDFGADTPTDALHEGDTQPARIYAASGDILDVEFGSYFPANNEIINSEQTVIAAKPFDIYAGRDIVDSGSILSPDIFLNLSSGDITSVSAGRDIIESSFDIAGPGEIVVQAGRNYHALENGVIDSIGPVFDIDPSNRDSGAGVALLAGVGTGPDYTGFADEFLNPDGNLDLEDASSVVAGDDAALYAWLQTNYGYAGAKAGAYADFLELSPSAQDVFLRQLYFSELNNSGLEFNNPASLHYKSYVLGRTAIAALFPAKDANGQPITYDGDITMFGGSGIHTNFGGAVEMLTPGGQTTIGVEGATPPASNGVITQGSGDIDIYALESVELGESRVLTTFGGNIVIWSTKGDINAGQGSKTTIDYTPLQRIYDNYGDVFLSPTVPSNGAGIATLNPIPSVPAGNIDLIAPLGTVDAGEAGIRGSGNLNIAALHVLNAANIQVQGATTGVPTAVAPDIGALTSTSNAAGAAAQAAEGGTGQTRAAPLPSIWIVEILGYGDDSGDSQPILAKPRKRVKPSKHQQVI